VPVVHMRLHLAVALLLTVAQWMKHVFVCRQLHPIAANLRRTVQAAVEVAHTQEPLRSPLRLVTD